MENNFEMPTINVVVFENEDVITSSVFSFIKGTYGTTPFNPFGE